MKTENLTLPVDLIEKLCSKAEENNMSVTDLLCKMLGDNKAMKKAIVIDHPTPSMNGKEVFVWRASGMRLRWISFSETGKHYLIDKKHLKYEESQV